MSETYLKTILENTKEAKKQWEEFSKICKDINDFKKKFHLRPTKKGVTIVSTLEKKPMRGRLVGKTVVKEWLEQLYAVTISTKSQEEKLKILQELKFDDRKQSSNSNEKNEEFYQAKMIAEMSENQTLKDFLKVDELIFIASEFILHHQLDESKRERIDIIGYDGKNRIFFFELKDPEDPKGDPVSQVKRYVEIYGGVKLKEMLEILNEYPINSVCTKDIVIEGYAVYGYSQIVNVNASKEFKDKDNVGIINFI
jgi:uncharacterized DUF497 family protein